MSQLLLQKVVFALALQVRMSNGSICFHTAVSYSYFLCRRRSKQVYELAGDVSLKTGI